MKKIIAVIAVLAVLFCGLSVSAASAASVNAYVTIADQTGNTVVAYEPVTVTDSDNDGALTVSDTLYSAHEAFYMGGAASGYAASVGAYGLSTTKLWGVEGAGFGYYLNNSSCWSAADVIADGDHLSAFIYTDTESWSDTYCYFDKQTLNATAGDTVELTLAYSSWDPLGNPISLPVEGASITLSDTVRGTVTLTDAKTDAEGKVSVKLEKGGDYIISAKSDIQVLVPPVCKASVKETAAVDVYVTIADAEGKLAVAQEKITVRNADNDSYLTVSDALYAAHEAFYMGGAASGYAASVGAYGLSPTKLWGVEGAGFGYYLNNSSCWSAADVVAEGDYLSAFIYTDTESWSDTYCYFDKKTVSAKAGETVTLTLSYLGYDASFNTVVSPVSNATITINGEASTYKTDANGKVTVTFEKEGNYTVSAKSDAQVLVPPVCKATVSAKETANTVPTSPKTGDDSVTLYAALFISMAVVSIFAKVKFSYEK